MTTVITKVVRILNFNTKNTFLTTNDKKKKCFSRKNRIVIFFLFINNLHTVLVEEKSLNT